MISSTANDTVKYVRALRRRDMRRREGCFVAEGIRLVEEALLSPVRPRLIVYDAEAVRSSARLADLVRRAGAENTLGVTSRIMGLLSDTVTPQGVLAVCPVVQPKLEELGFLVLVLDGLQDPGNVGAILRSAEALGASAVVSIAGTTDLFGPKCVRGAMGAHFRLALYPDLAWEEALALLKGRRLIVAVPKGGRSPEAIDWSAPTALLLGSEPGGPRVTLEGLGAVPVSVPMSGGADSLNVAVAAGILLYEAAHQRREATRAGVARQTPERVRP